MASIIKGVLNREEAVGSLAVARQLQQNYAGKQINAVGDMQGYFIIITIEWAVVAQSERGLVEKWRVGWCAGGKWEVPGHRQSTAEVPLGTRGVPRKRSGSQEKIAVEYLYSFE